MWKMAQREFRTLYMQYWNWQGLGILVFVVLYSVLLNGEGAIFNFFMMISGISILALTEVENRNKVYKTILSIPCTRKEYVYGKFMANVLWICIMAIIGLLLNLVLNFISPAKFVMVSAGVVKILISYILICTGIYYLVYFAVGIKWAKIAYFVSFIAMMIGIISVFNVAQNLSTFTGFIGKLIKIFESKSIINNVILIIIVSGIEVLLAYISFIFYDKKDF